MRELAQTAEFVQTGPALGNPFAADPLLQAWLRWRLPADLQEDLAPGLLAFGARVQDEIQDLGLQAEAHPPRHIPFGPWGERIDQIEVSGAWGRLQDIAAEEGLVALAHERSEGAWSRLHQFARLYLFHPDSAWSTAPLSMTDGAARVLELHGSARLKEEVLPRLLSRRAGECWTAGRWTTEREGGSDLARTATTARRRGHGLFDWQLHGTKWFTTATLSPVALALARAEGAPEGADGLSLFLVELFDGDGRLRGLHVDRLIDKVGMRALPTAELTLDGAHAALVGEKGHGLRALAGLLDVTRAHNTLYAAAAMRRALALAKDYAGRRQAFGKSLREQPLHAETLACLQVEWEGCFHLAFHLALLLGRHEAGEARPGEAALLRLLIPVAKLYTGKQAVWAACEAAEAFGGAGYVEDTGLPVLVRNALVLPVWDGTTSVLSLEALRAMDREPAFEAFVEDVQARLRPIREDSLAGGPEGLRKVRRSLEQLREARARIAGGEAPGGVAPHAEAQARAFAFGLARTYAGSLLLEHAAWLSAGSGASGHARAARAAQVALRWCREPMVALPSPDTAWRASTAGILDE